jgi:CrcB protein
MLLGIAAFAAAGAMVRHWVVRWSPYGTLIVNVTGSFLLGLVTGLGHGPKTLVGTGFCGALTTFSAFGYETVRLVEDGFRRQAAGYVAVSVAAGTAAAALGLWLV